MSKDIRLTECMNILRDLSMEHQEKQNFATHFVLEAVRDKIDDYCLDVFSKEQAKENEE